MQRQSLVEKLNHGNKDTFLCAAQIYCLAKESFQGNLSALADGTLTFLGWTKADSQYQHLIQGSRASGAMLPCLTSIRFHSGSCSLRRCMLQSTPIRGIQESGYVVSIGGNLLLVGACTQERPLLIEADSLRLLGRINVLEHVTHVLSRPLPLSSSEWVAFVRSDSGHYSPQLHLVLWSKTRGLTKSFPVTWQQTEIDGSPVVRYSASQPTFGRANVPSGSLVRLLESESWLIVVLYSPSKRTEGTLYFMGKKDLERSTGSDIVAKKAIIPNVGGMLDAVASFDDSNGTNVAVSFLMPGDPNIKSGRAKLVTNFICPLNPPSMQSLRESWFHMMDCTAAAVNRNPEDSDTLVTWLSTGTDSCCPGLVSSTQKKGIGQDIFEHYGCITGVGSVPGKADERFTILVSEDVTGSEELKVFLDTSVTGGPVMLVRPTEGSSMGLGHGCLHGAWSTRDA